MRILHTADWHLGKRLYNFSRMEEQQKVLAEICEITESNNIDVVLIAGDLLDSFNPSNEALDLFYKTLKRLSDNGNRLVVAIGGNHDSADKIDAPDVLARECGIILIGYPNSVIPTFELNTGLAIVRSDAGFIEVRLPKYDYPLRLLLTPFANELRLKQYLGEEEKGTALNHILQASWQKTADSYCDENGVNILTAHLYMMQRGGPVLEEPEGEKPLNIGNADLVFTDNIPKQIQYTALGHLHKFQSIGGHAAPVCYSSSPLAYSFSEADQVKFVNIIDVVPGKFVSTESVALKAGRTLLRKTFEDIDEAVNWLQENPNTLLELTIISDDFLRSEDLKRLQTSHDGIMQVIPKVKNNAIGNSKNANIDLSKDIQELFAAYFTEKNKQVPNAQIMQLFNEILNA